MRNVAELIVDRAYRRPDARFGVADEVGGPWRLADAVEIAGRAATGLVDGGVGPGRRVALIGTTSNSYLLSWMALMLGGVEVALINPTYPAELLAEMVANLEPDAVIWAGRTPDASVAPSLQHIDATSLAAGTLLVAGGGELALDAPKTLAGLARKPDDVAGYMHTSGTTGTPKFCEQSHEYFIRLGRFVADSWCLSDTDTVLAPLPMFHINPLGYGVVGGLTAGADVLGLTRFSASAFWPTVLETKATFLVLHAPPVEILKQATHGEDAAGHHVRGMFFADVDFLETFEIPLGFSAYGSTEAGGLSHTWVWRRGDIDGLAEGASRYGGRARHDLEWKVSDDGEISVRARVPGVLFTGYRNGGELVQPFDDGWFATGDVGRVDELGNLVFIERRSESIRVKGEYVPIGYVEQRFTSIATLSDLAVWRRKSELVDDEVVLYVVGAEVPVSEVRAVSQQLPKFMRPSAVVRIGEMPRDTGVGKVRRRLLETIEPLEVVEL